jgi:hypothetical protein
LVGTPAETPKAKMVSEELTGTFAETTVAMTVLEGLTGTSAETPGAMTVPEELTETPAEIPEATTKLEELGGTSAGSPEVMNRSGELVGTSTETPEAMRMSEELAGTSVETPVPTKKPVELTKTLAEPPEVSIDAQNATQKLLEEEDEAGMLDVAPDGDADGGWFEGKKREYYAQISRVASPRDKKRNQSRRNRRQAARQRIARETRDRKERERRMEAKANRVRKEPKMRPVTLAGRAVIIEEGSTWRRLPQKSDLGKYVIRRFQGRQWHIWVEPCWVGVCSQRRHMNELSKKETKFCKEKFMRCARKIRENPAFKLGDDLSRMIDWRDAVKSPETPETQEQSWAEEMMQSPIS